MAENKNDDMGGGYADGQSTLQGGPVLRTYIDVLRRRVWIIVAATVILGSIGVVRAFRAPNVYMSSVRLMVERHTPKVISFDPSFQDRAYWDPEYYNTQAQLITYRAVMERAMEQSAIRQIMEAAGATPPTGSTAKDVKETFLSLLGAAPAPPPQPWERLRNHISAKVVRDSQFIEVRAVSGDRKISAVLAEGVAEAFQAYHLSLRTNMLGSAYTYLAEEKRKSEDSLTRAEKALQDFRQKARGIDLAADPKDQPAIDKLSRINERLTDIQLKKAELRAATEIINGVLKSDGDMNVTKKERLFSLPAVRDDPAIATVQRRISDAEKNMSVISRTYGNRHPAFVEAQTNMAILNRQFVSALNQAILSQNNKLQTMLNEEKQLQEAYEAQKVTALDTAKESFKFARLQMEVDRHAKIHDALVRRMLEVDISTDMASSTNIQIVDKSTPDQPVSPDRRKMILLSIFLGICTGILLSFVFEHLDDTIKTPEDLKDQRLDLPLLGFVPLVEKEQDDARAHDESHAALFVLKEPMSSVAEAYRHIRTSLFYAPMPQNTKFIAVTSCHPGEGKTTTISNLALVVAQSGKRVLLIDGDTHRPHIHNVFGIAAGLGLTDILSGRVPWQEVVLRANDHGIAIDNLDIIVAGSSIPNPSELLSGERMKSLMAEAKERYDWVFVDTPPLLFVSDASVISAVCDAVILIAKAGVNNRSLLIKAKEQLQGLKVKILGMVLNQMVVSYLGRRYSYYYYHGYSRYSSDYHRSYYQKPVQKQSLMAKLTGLFVRKQKDTRPNVTSHSKGTEEHQGRSASRSRTGRHGRHVASQASAQPDHASTASVDAPHPQSTQSPFTLGHKAIKPLSQIETPSTAESRPEPAPVPVTQATPATHVEPIQEATLVPAKELEQTPPLTQETPVHVTPQEQTAPPAPTPVPTEDSLHAGLLAEAPARQDDIASKLERIENQHARVQERLNRLLRRVRDNETHGGGNSPS